MTSTFFRLTLSPEVIHALVKGSISLRFYFVVNNEKYIFSIKKLTNKRLVNLSCCSEVNKMMDHTTLVIVRRSYSKM